MTHLSDSFVLSYARPPSDDVIQRAIKHHTAVRDLLGTGYLTLLQGSYRNHTALAELNDVDILAIDRAMDRDEQARRYGDDAAAWRARFSQIERALQRDPRYAERWERRDKCIRLNTPVRLDIVPALGAPDAERDPIVIYSFERRETLRSWPRAHYEANVAKSQATHGAFKQTVRLLKRWARAHFGRRPVAPSYMIEALVHSVPDARFQGRPAEVFYRVISTLLDTHRPLAQWLLSPSSLDRYRAAHELPRPGVPGEVIEDWPEEARRELFDALADSREALRAALTAPTPARAEAAWRSAFHGQ